MKYYAEEQPACDGVSEEMRSQRQSSYRCQVKGRSAWWKAASATPVGSRQQRLDQLAAAALGLRHPVHRPAVAQAASSSSSWRRWAAADSRTRRTPAPLRRSARHLARGCDVEEEAAAAACVLAARRHCQPGVRGAWCGVRGGDRGRCFGRCLRWCGWYCGQCSRCLVRGAVFEVVRPVLRPVFEVLGAVFEYRVRRKISVSRRLLSPVSTWRARQSVRCQQI